MQYKIEKDMNVTSRQEIGVLNSVKLEYPLKNEDSFEG